MILWLLFLLCTAFIVYSGYHLSRYGDVIAEKTGLGRTWVGVVIMAAVTSLPELITGLSAVTYADVPDIAAGGVLGSCVFNILILALLDALHPNVPICTEARQGHILSAGYGILLLGVVGGGLMIGRDFPGLGWIGGYSLIIVAIYVVAERQIYIYEKKQLNGCASETTGELKYENVTTKSAVQRFSFHAAVVVVAAVFLPEIGEGIARASSLGETFVGNIFIAVSTSLPEVVVSVAALRIGAIDLAIGNLFGSNIFNILILAIDDMFFLKGPLLSFVDMNHLVPLMAAIIMTAIAIIGLIYRSGKKKLILAWDSLFIVLAYLTTLVVLYVKK